MAEGASAVLVYCVKLSRCVTFYVRVVSIETLTHIYPNSFSSASAVYTFALPHDLSSHIQLRIQLQRSALLNSQFDSDHSRCTARLSMRQSDDRHDERVPRGTESREIGTGQTMVPKGTES